MKIARVTGTVVSTIKYEKYVGMKLLRVRHLTLDGQPTGEELIALGKRFGVNPVQSALDLYK
mgnify:CR=1 FL=1